MINLINSMKKAFVYGGKRVMKTAALLVVAMVFAALPAVAEEIVFFDAATAGDGVWSWGSARIKAEAGRLVVREANLKDAYGDVYPSDMFPYAPKARLSLDVERIFAGTFTLQVLCFRGPSLLQTIDLIKDSKEARSRVFRMSDVGVPPETQGVMFKLWVANAKGASLVLKDLRYSLEVPGDKLVASVDFRDLSAWTNHAMEVQSTDNGVLLMPTGVEKAGSMWWTRSVEATRTGSIILHVPQVSKSVTTLQLDVFDRDDQYLGAVNVFENVGSGWHGSPMSVLRWPEGAARYQVKLWAAGGEGSFVGVDRLLIVED